MSVRVRHHGTVCERKAGYNPPQGLIDRLRREHPRIRLLYSPDVGEWLLFQLVPGGMHLFCTAGARPSEPYIMRKLAFGKVGSMTQSQLEEWTARVDAVEESFQRAVDARASERYQDVADRIYSATGTETRVSMGGQNRKRNRRSRP